MINFSHKHLLIIAVFIVGLIITAIMATPIIEKLSSNRTEALAARAKASKEIAYAGENISFSSKGSTGDIHNYTWNFSDGNFSSEPNPLHVFNLPRWYNVTLTIANKAGKTDISQLVIGIQHINETNDRQGNRIIDINPRKAAFTYWALKIGPNIQNPTTNFNVDIQNGIGQFWVDIYVQIHYPDGTMSDESIYVEQFNLAHENYHFNRTVLPDVLSRDISNNSAGIAIVAGIDQGTWSGISGTVTSFFNIEGLEAKLQG